MQLRNYLFFLFVASVFCWGAFALIVSNVSPDEAGFFGFSALVASFFFGLVGSSTLIGFFVRKRLSNNAAHFGSISVAFRQGILLSLVVMGLIGLQSLRLLNLWSGGLLAIGVFLFEFYFRGRWEVVR
jgi:hypothetical protein